jgi:hypothetical protein
MTKIVGDALLKHIEQHMVDAGSEGDGYWVSDLLHTILLLRILVMEMHPLYHPDCETCRKVDRLLVGDGLE